NRLSNLEALVVRDSSSAPASGKAMVRFVHLSPDAQAMDIGVSGDENLLFENATFKDATDYKEVDAKTYSFELKNAGAEDAILSANDIAIREGRFYTIIIRG